MKKILFFLTGVIPYAMFANCYEKKYFLNYILFFESINFPCVASKKNIKAFLEFDSKTQASPAYEF